MKLYSYQTKLIDDTRVAFREHKHVCIQAPTGSGKTVTFCEMVKRITERGLRSWVVVQRNELLRQTSEHLGKFGVSHGQISATMKESRAFVVHVVSLLTLVRRLKDDKIINLPDIIFMDECHLSLAQQIALAEAFPETRFFGWTATPERLDGQGLSELYGTLVEGPSLASLVQMEFLSAPKYFCYPIKGMNELKRVGTEFTPESIDALLEARKIYGKTIEHYRKYADGKPCIVFCRDLNLCKKTASQFRDAGYRFESIEGSMSDKKRKALLDALRTGEIHGLCSAQLLTYGIDVPEISCIIMLRPTMSTALYFQMLGRGLRVAKDKSHCVILDHVNNLVTHKHPLLPRQWRFDGTEKAIAEPDESIKLRLCPDTFMYCEKPTCKDCFNNSVGRKTRAEHVINVELEEVENPVEMNARPLEERQEIQSRLNAASDKYEAGGVASGAVGEMLKLARILGQQPMWVYHRLCKDKYMVNSTLLHEIARQKGYKPGWCWMQKKRMKGE